MRSAKVLLLIALAALIAGVPVSGALAKKDDASDGGVCIPIGGAEIAIPPGKCKDKQDKPDNEKEPPRGNANGAQGKPGETGDKPGKHSGARAPRDSDARPLPLPAHARPVFGRAIAAVAVSGEVRVKLPGASSFVTLTDAARLPNGSLVDASLGVVQVSSARANGASMDTAAFSGTTFSIRQPRSASGLTELRLRDGQSAACRSTRAFASAARSTGKRLWGNGHGRFRTRGRYGSATVRGTVWATEDRCDGTLVRVRRGRVAVRDLARGVTTLVRAGHSRFVRAPR